MPLTRETILDAARAMVARHGPSKATVLDVAQALGVSHGSIYRFFTTKAELREAVVGQWLDEIVTTLARQRFTGTAAQKLRAWFDAYLTAKRNQRAQSPELFEAFRELSAQEPQTIAAYKSRLIEQMGLLLQEGVRSGEFVALEVTPTAKAFLVATMRFHHPYFATDWDRPETGDFDTLWALLVRSISSERKPS